MNDFVHTSAWFSVDGDIPSSISVKYPSRQRTFRNSLELLYPSFSSSPRTVYPPFFVSPVTSNKGSVSSYFSFSSSSCSSFSSFSVKMMRTLESSVYHPLSIFHLPAFTPSLFSSHPYSPMLLPPRFLFCRRDTFPSLFRRQAYFWMIHIHFVAALTDLVPFLSCPLLRNSHVERQKASERILNSVIGI